MTKSESLKQIKSLIKKYHPDLHSNADNESLYNEITVNLVNKLNQIKNKENTRTQKAEDQDYKYYKLGMKYYRNIHPNRFYERNADTTFKTKTRDELVLVLNKILLSFNLSEYYFKKVIDEYPQSAYCDDSKAKIQLLNKLYKSYKNIELEENRIINNDAFIKEMGLKII